MTPELTQKVKILRYRNTSELLALAWVGGARCRVVGPGDGVVRVCAGGGTDESEQLADDAGVAHRPSGSGLERAGGDSVLMVGPAHAVGIDRRPGGEVVDEHVGKVERFCLLDVAVAGQR